MKRSTDRILTTDAYTLPRPSDLTHMMPDTIVGRTRPRCAPARPRPSRRWTTASASSGFDIVIDGEMSKIGFSNYVVQRYFGFGRPASITASHVNYLATSTPRSPPTEVRTSLAPAR